MSSKKAGDPTPAQVQAVKARIQQDSAFAMHVLRMVYRVMPQDEREARRHLRHDGKGFTEYDTPRLCGLAERLMRGEQLTIVEADEVRASCDKYARQFLRISKARREQLRGEAVRTEAKIWS